MVLFAALSGNVLADLNDGLVAYYPFNGDAKDESGNENDGTVNGATLIEDRFGNKESAYSFDGNDDCILANDSTTLDIQNNISLIAWIKTRGTHKTNSGMIVAKHYTHWARAYALYDQKVYSSQKYPDGIILSYVDIHNNDHVTITDRTDDNNWHLIVGTYNKSTGISELYVDGILKNSKNFGKINLMQTSIPASIGCYLSSNSGTSKREFFNGLIDDVRIYNRALSESEIQQLYNAEQEKEEQPPTEISSKAIYDSLTNTLSLEGILVPFIDEFTGKATDKKGIFDVQLEEKTKLVFQVIPWSINVKGTLEGENTSGYILYHHKTRSVEIPCFKVTTIAKLGDGIEGDAVYYKDVIMKQRHLDYPIFHVEDMTEADSCK